MPLGRSLRDFAARGPAQGTVGSHEPAKFGLFYARETASERSKQSESRPISGFRGDDAAAWVRRFGGQISLLTPMKSAPGLFCVCGLGNPDAFFRDLGNWGLLFVVKPSFPITTAIPSGTFGSQRQGKAWARALLDDEKDAQNLSRINFEDAPVYFAVIVSL